MASRSASSAFPTLGRSCSSTPSPARRDRVREGERRHGPGCRRAPRPDRAGGARQEGDARLPEDRRRSRERAQPSAISARSTPSCSSSTAGPARETPKTTGVTLGLELLSADREHVERRLERPEQAKSGDPAAGRGRRAPAPGVAPRRGDVATFSEPIPAELEPLTTKPLLAVVNGAEGIDLQLEAELAELSAEEASAFREGASALEDCSTALRRARPSSASSRPATRRRGLGRSGAG